MSNVPNESDSLWNHVDPRWMASVRPQDFDFANNQSYLSLCPGLLFMPGLFGLVAIHVLATTQVVGAVTSGYWSPLTICTLSFLGTLWIWFVYCDVRFRVLGANSNERRAFDNAVINWFGFVATPIWFVGGLGFIIYLSGKFIITIWGWFV